MQKIFIEQIPRIMTVINQTDVGGLKLTLLKLSFFSVNAN